VRPEHRICHLAVLERQFQALPETYRKNDLLRKLRANTLDEEYMRNSQLAEYAHRYLTVLGNVDLTYRLMDRTSRLNREILLFIIGYFEKNRYIGIRSAVRQPSIITVLGCASEPIMRKRVMGASAIYQRVGAAYLVFSGGGYGSVDAESDVMRRMWPITADVVPNILLEPYSLDTIGNALFTKLILKEKGILKDDDNILVITSEFHSIRSLQIFRKVYGPRARIAVAGIDTIDDKDRNANLLWAEKELSSEMLNERFFEIRVPGGRLPKMRLHGDGSTLVQLVLEHKLYQNRFDLLRRFSGFLPS